MPAEVRTARQLAWIQSFIGMKSLLYVYFIFVMSAGRVPWVLWGIAAAPMLTGPLSLLFRLRSRWVRGVVIGVEGVFVAGYVYLLLLLRTMDIFTIAYVALGIGVIVKLSTAAGGRWFDR